MPPEAWTGVGDAAAASLPTSSGRILPVRAPSRSTTCTKGGRGSREPRDELDRIARPRDDVVELALPQPHGLGADDVDGRDQLEARSLLHCAVMLTC